MCIQMASNFLLSPYCCLKELNENLTFSLKGVSVRLLTSAGVIDTSDLTLRDVSGIICLPPSVGHYLLVPNK